MTNLRQKKLARFGKIVLLCAFANLSFAYPSTNAASAAQTLGLNEWTVGSVSFGDNYDSLLGNIFNLQYSKMLTPRFGFGAIGEYGPNQYRFNGTLGTQLTANLQAKVSAEYLSQVLPFDFNSGNIDERVGQSAYGLDLRQSLSNATVRDFDIGGYWADAPNKSLAPIFYTQNDLIYYNQRNIAGAISQGLHAGVDLKLTRTTLLEPQFFYDNVYYRTQLVSNSAYNTSGAGGGVELDQILNDKVKLSLSAQLRQIYNTYSAELDWRPMLARNFGLECALQAQHLTSSNATPNSNSIGLEISLLPENTKPTAYKLNETHTNEKLASWVKTPAVYMQRVMVQAEQITTLISPFLQSISPSAGPATGGNTVSLFGSNFAAGATVTFGGIAGTVTFISASELSVVVPAHSATTQKITSTESVNVVVTNPNGYTSTLSNGYSYTGVNAPTLASASPPSGSTAGGTSVTLTGTHLATVTSVTFGGSAASGITVINDSEIVVTTPAHAAGSVDIVATNAEGSGTLTNGYTYAGVPTVTGLSPNNGFISGGTSVTITGTNFTGATAVNFGATAATSFTIDSVSSITAVSPAGSAGTVNVTVTTPGGTSTTSSADEYTYTSPHIIFVTSSTFDGNLGGFSGADAKCNSDSAKPGGFAASYTYKALLNGNNATTTGVTYYRTNGTTEIATATGGNLVGSGSLTNSVNGSSTPSAWTGAGGTNNCTIWTSNSGGVNGDRGSPGSTSSTYWNTGASNCSGGASARALYCVSQ